VTGVLPPGPRLARPAQTLWWATRPGTLLERSRDRFGDVFTLRIEREGAWVVISHPDHVRQVFTGDPAVYHAGEGNRILLPLVGHHSLLLLDEDRHLRERKLLLPPFHGERMQSYGALMREVAEAEVATWPRAEPFALAPRMQALTLEVIMRAVFGMAAGPRLDALRAALRALLAEIMTLPALLLVALLGAEGARRTPFTRRVLAEPDRLIHEEIAARRRDPRLAEREDILSLLLQARHDDGSPISDEELRDELMTLLVAGHETTATALAWALERLARHPERLERLRAEVDAGGEEYADAVIRETLRLRPVIPIVARQLTQPVEIGDWRLPAGARVVPCVYLVHRRPDVYPDPHAFRPERFLERPPGTYTWLPFGGGVRRCIGASFATFEMKRVLEAVVGQLDVAPSRPASERIARRAITLVPERGGEVVVRPLARRTSSGAPGRAPARAA
jgi:cytochrome P450 family 135